MADAYSFSSSLRQAKKLNHFSFYITLTVFYIKKNVAIG
jgi:hypothetical protein